MGYDMASSLPTSHAEDAFRVLQEKPKRPCEITIEWNKQRNMKLEGFEASLKDDDDPPEDTPIPCAADPRKYTRETQWRDALRQQLQFRTKNCAFRYVHMRPDPLEEDKKHLVVFNCINMSRNSDLEAIQKMVDENDKVVISYEYSYGDAEDEDDYEDDGASPDLVELISVQTDGEVRVDDSDKDSLQINPNEDEGSERSEDDDEQSTSEEEEPLTSQNNTPTKQTRIEREGGNSTEADDTDDDTEETTSRKKSKIGEKPSLSTTKRKKGPKSLTREAGAKTATKTPAADDGDEAVVSPSDTPVLKKSQTGKQPASKTTNTPTTGKAATAAGSSATTTRKAGRKPRAKKG